MSARARLSRRRYRSPVELAKRTVGNATVVYASERMSNEALSMAMSVAPDPDNELVVVDLPSGSPIAVWESLATCVPRGRGGVRLVVGDRSREATALAGQWLAERLGRPVVAPDGPVVRGAGGSLFVHAGPDSGWVRFRPGRPPQWEAKRFPCPSWDARVIAELFPTSSVAAAEPLPGGVWIRPAGDETTLRVARSRLVNEMPCQLDVLTVVLGCPGMQPISLDDVARFLITVPEEVRPKVRFAPYGPVRHALVPLGQALANELTGEVVCYTGLPVGSPLAPDVYTVREDGSLGWHSFVEQIAFWPQHNGEPPVPALRAHRSPVAGVPEIEPAVYWYAHDAVLEVVQAGLWIRPPRHTVNPAPVRAVPAAPAENLVVFETAGYEDESRMRELAEDVFGRLDHATRQLSRLVPAAALRSAQVRVTGLALAALEEPVGAAAGVTDGGARERTAAISAPVLPVEQSGPLELMNAQTSVGPYSPVSMRLESAPADAPVLPSPAAPERLPEPLSKQAAEVVEAGGQATAVAVRTRPATAVATPRPRGRLQPVPESAASALLPTRGIAEERAWLRTNLGSRFGVMANTIARVLSEYPGFQGTVSRTSSDVLTEAVAVRLYLSEDGAGLDTALRGATVGPHVPFARCVVAGLRRLPSHRGATVFTTTPTESEWDLYTRRRLVTEWGFRNALTEPCAAPDGTVDVLVWSMTARRTRLLEPDEPPVEGRVLFVPGTSFKVLEMTEPKPDSRGLILMRELAASEIGADGRVDSNRISLDELATKSLRRCVERWAAGEPAQRIPPALAGRFQSLPGLAYGEEAL